MSSGLSKITPTTLAITLAIALVGCGRLTPGQLRVSASTWNPGSSTVSDPDSDYNCPSGNNVVPYEKIAEARISYGGRGRLTEVQQPGVLHQLYDRVAPF